MRKTVLLFASLALAVLLFAAIPGSTPPTAAQESPSKPNFVFILADDMRADDLKYMPKTRRLLGDQGVRFQNAYVATAWCCPARATILRGQYAHNTGVWSSNSGPDGGWEGYKSHGLERNNIATRLDDAGYRTALLGKYFNGYSDAGHVPPGWDRWFAKVSPTVFEYYNYDVSADGHLRHFGEAERAYSTDVIKRRTQAFIDASAGRPFFAFVSPTTPHSPWISAVRHEHTFDGEQAPRLPSFNEEDVSDKPPWIQDLPPLDEPKIVGIDVRQEYRAEMLQSLDDLVEGVVNKLREERVLKNTYIVFTSDNGFQMGEHRIPLKKTQPYQESVHMPLLMRGPGIEAGVRTNKLALNTDYFPTFADLAGIQTPQYVDGRSLRPVLQGSASEDTWRSAILLEQRDSYETSGGVAFSGILTTDRLKYLEYESGFRELYDLNTDPYELENSYDAKTPPTDLAERLQALKVCAGATCRAAENGP